MDVDDGASKMGQDSSVAYVDFLLVRRQKLHAGIYA